MAKNFEIGRKKTSTDQKKLPPEIITQRESTFITGRERDVVKSIRMSESIHKRLKYYALLQGRTETDIVVEVLRRELDALNIRLPAEMV